MLSPYEILGIKPSAQVTMEQIRKAYKEIALTCHPDKLSHISDDNEKQRRIDKFKNATIAYNKLINGTYIDTDDGFYDWKEMWENYDDDFNIKDVFFDIAKMFINNKIFPKTYYNPDIESTSGSSSSSASASTSTSGSSSPRSVKSGSSIVHNLSLDITYADILHNKKRKVRLILTDISEPIFIEVQCATAYPQIVKQYYDHHTGTDHDIVIKICIKSMQGYDHIMCKNGAIDLVTNFEISLLEYITGCTKELNYIDNTSVPITIPEFHPNDYIEIPNKGLLKGSLVVKLQIQHIRKDAWIRLSENDKVEMIRILGTLLK